MPKRFEKLVGWGKGIFTYDELVPYIEVRPNISAANTPDILARLNVGNGMASFAYLRTRQSGWTLLAQSVLIGQFMNVGTMGQPARAVQNWVRDQIPKITLKEETRRGRR
jgi:hypothetical protein